MQKRYYICYSEIRLARANNLRMLPLDDIIANKQATPKELLTTMQYQKNSINVRSFQEKLQHMEVLFQ